jgi:hypothetical protein
LVVLFIGNSFKEYQHAFKQNFVAFFVFGETEAWFSKRFARLLPDENGKTYCFCPKVNSARTFGAEQSMKLRGKTLSISRVYAKAAYS